MDTREIKQAAEILARGGKVVFPTETLYGLAALATNTVAVRKVYAIKGRPKGKLLPVIVGSVEQARKYFVFNRVELALAKKFWPGPLSLMLKTRSKELAAAVGSDCVAVRYSANAVAAKLALLVGAPITSTSANVSEKPGCFTIRSAKGQFRHIFGKQAYPDMFLDGGTLKRSLPSTIIQVKRGRIVIVREGKVPRAVLMSAFLSPVLAAFSTHY